MGEEEIEEFFLQQKKWMDVPEEDITAYMARRTQMRSSSSIAHGKRKSNGTPDEETSIASKKSKISENARKTSSKVESVTTSARHQLSSKLPCTSKVQSATSIVEDHINDNIDVEVPVSEGVTGFERTPARTSPVAALPEIPLASHPDDNNMIIEQHVNRQSNAPSPIEGDPPHPIQDSVTALLPSVEPPSLIGSAAKSPAPNSGLISRTGLRRQQSVSIVSHQHVSKHTTRRNNPIIKSKQAPHITAADTSNITTPASTPVDMVKMQTTMGAASCSSSAGAKGIPDPLPDGKESVVNAREKLHGQASAAKSALEKVKTVAKRQAKQKSPMMTPIEYAEMLTAKYSDPCRKVSKNVIQYLRGKNIFYTEGDLNFAGESTRKKMEIIVKHGGTLVPKYTPDGVTHIVTGADERATAKALGLSSIMEIPMHIPTVKWSWIDSGHKVRRKANAPLIALGEEPPVRMAPAYLHCAFKKRFDAGDFPGGWGGRKNVQKGGGNPKANTTDPEYSRISEFTENPNDSDYNTDESDILQTLPSQSSSKISRTHGDPLAEFYNQAKADVEWGMDESDVEDEDMARHESDGNSSKNKNSGWTCDKKGGILKGPCPNQDIVDKLMELQGLHKGKPGEENSWRVFSYSKSIRAIINHPTRIKSETEACAINGVGEKTAKKIMEIIRTGDLRRIEYENTDDVRVNKLFQGIFGVGMKTAYTWYANGARTLEDVLVGKGGIKLTTQQDIGIRFYNDINERMPRNEAEEIFKKIENIALQIDPKLFIKIMGSFRRGAETCGDIDILITRPVYDGKTHSGVVRKIWRECHAKGIITEDLVMPDDFNQLELIYRGLCRKDETGKRRRIDFLSIPWDVRGAALLYYTGDAIFNRSMRLKARRHGMSLNQRGLFGGVVRNPQNQALKTNEGQLLAAETEEEIFRILNVPWQEPHERVRGDVV